MCWLREQRGNQLTGWHCMALLTGLLAGSASGTSRSGRSADGGYGKSSAGGSSFKHQMVSIVNYDAPGSTAQGGGVEGRSGGRGSHGLAAEGSAGYGYVTVDYGSIAGEHCAMGP